MGGVNDKEGSNILSANNYKQLKLSKDDIQKIIQGTHPSIKYVKSSPSATNYGVENQLVIGGRKYSVIGDAFNDPINKISKNAVELEKHRRKILTKKITALEGVEDFTNPEQDELKPVRARIGNLFGAVGVKTDAIRLLSRDRKGGVYFSITPSKEDALKPEEFRKTVTALGGRYIEATNSYYIPNSELGSAVRPRSFSDARLEAIDTQVKFLTPKTGVKVFRTSNIRFNNMNFEFKVVAEDGVPRYQVVHKDSGAVIPGVYADIESAALSANTLANLPKDQFQLRIRTLGGVKDYTIQ